MSDLAGEKLHESDLATLIRNLEQKFPSGAISFLRVMHTATGQGEYLILARSATHRTAAEGEAELLKHHHYRVARELNQLRPLSVVNVPQPIDLYEKIRLLSGRVASTGQIKIEAVLSMTDDDFEQLGIAKH